MNTTTSTSTPDLASFSVGPYGVSFVANPHATQLYYDINYGPCAVFANKSELREAYRLILNLLDEPGEEVLALRLMQLAEINGQFPNRTICALSLLASASAVEVEENSDGQVLVALTEAGESFLSELAA
jgi:hypothetical protein